MLPESLELDHIAINVKENMDEAYELFSINFNTLCSQEFSKLQKQLHTR